MKGKFHGPRVDYRHTAHDILMTNRILLLIFLALTQTRSKSWSCTLHISHRLKWSTSPVRWDWGQITFTLKRICTRSHRTEGVSLTLLLFLESTIYYKSGRVQQALTLKLRRSRRLEVVIRSARFLQCRRNIGASLVTRGKLQSTTMQVASLNLLLSGGFEPTIFLIKTWLVWSTIDTITPRFRNIGLLHFTFFYEPG
jgi:hypothetical protein